MKIYPVVSNSIKIETENGDKFEITEEGNGGRLHIRAVDGYVTVNRLNVETVRWDEISTEYSITITKVKEPNP